MMFLYAVLLGIHIVYMTNAILCGPNHNKYEFLDVEKLTTISEVLEMEKNKMEECFNKLGLKKTMLTDYINGKTTEATRELKCGLGCYLEEMGYAKDNKPQWDVIDRVHKIEYKSEEIQEKASQIVKTCKTIVPEMAEDSCELGFAVYTCYMKEAVKVKLLKPQGN